MSAKYGGSGIKKQLLGDLGGSCGTLGITHFGQFTAVNYFVAVRLCVRSNRVLAAAPRACENALWSVGA